MTRKASRRSLRQQFLAFDDELARQGVPPCTGWWRDGIGRWLDAYEGGHVLELWGACGRGAAKSTALYKMATFFTLFGDFTVPPGERHLAVVLSRLKEEAAKGIDIIAAWLRLLRVPHHVAGDVLELEGQSRGIRVVAASVAGASGWRAYFVGKDERSKWAAGGVAELDAEEIDTSATAMTATHALAPVVSFGSAWGKFGAFYDAITTGTDDRKFVIGPAPTWVAAPHITEESTRRKERDPKRWAREYKCEFQAGVSDCFDSDDIARAFDPRPLGVAIGPRVCVIDSASARKDFFTFGICGFERPAAEAEAFDLLTFGTPREQRRRAHDADAPLVLPPPTLRFEIVDGIGPDAARALGSAGVVAKIASVAREHGADTVHADQREAFALEAEFKRARLRFRTHDWTATSKPDAVAIVRRWFRESAIALPSHEALRRELLSFEERLTASGAFTFGARGSGHDDFVALLITAALAHLDGALRDAPPRPRPRAPAIETYDSPFDF